MSAAPHLGSAVGEEHSSPGHGADSDQASPAVASVIDPELAPLAEETSHRLTLEVKEGELEVAPGVWQRWTLGAASSR